MSKAITMKDFQEMKVKGGLYLIDFWATWCPPCKAMGPIIDQFSQDEDLKNITFVKCDVDDNQDLAAEFEVTSIPTFYLIKFKGDGTFNKENDIIETYVGAQQAFDFKMSLQDKSK